MKNAILIHGKPSRERYENPKEPKPHVANWFPWIGKQLSSRGIEVVIPAMPKPYFPVYAAWKQIFERHAVTSETALVGHSAGAEFILRWLSENTEASAERIVLVAPYKDYAGKYGEFSDYELDSDLVKRAGSVTILHSVGDDEPIARRAYELKNVLSGSKLTELSGYGHFRIGHNMPSEEFPILLEELARH